MVLGWRRIHPLEIKAIENESQIVIRILVDQTKAGNIKIQLMLKDTVINFAIFQTQHDRLISVIKLR